MEKRINGKRFNTETARKLAEWGNNADDENQVIESLYRKKSGEFFLHCRGGALVPYLDSLDAQEGTIKPLTSALAKKWVKNRLTPEAYERIFFTDGEDEDIETEMISAPIAKYLKVEMDITRKATGETISEFLSRAIKMLLETTKKDSIGQ